MTEWLDLTAAQRGLYFAHQLDPENPCYTTAEVVEFSGPIDADRFSRALGAAYTEYEQLRVVFRSTPRGPQQRVVDAGAPLRVLDVSSPEAAEQWMREDLALPMDLALLPIDTVRTALLRLPDGRTWWYHAAHHLVVDGYGIQHLISRVARLYADPAPADRSVTLADLVAGEPHDDAGAAAWDERLADMDGIVSLAGRTADPSPTAIKRRVDLTEEQQQAIARGARRLGVSWTDVFTAAVGGYVARMTGRDRARVGIPLMNRSLPGVGTLPAGRSVCTATNVLPATVPACGSVAEALEGVRVSQREIREDPFIRQEDLARRLRAVRPGAQLFGAQINLVPFDLEVSLATPDGGTVVPGVVRNLTAGPVEDMTICLRGAPGRRRTVVLEIDANPALYQPEDVERHLERLAAWLETYASAPGDRRVEDLPLLTARERELVLHEFNDTHVDRRPATLAERFVAQAERTPDATALVVEGSTLSYSRLLAGARRVAAALAEEGVVRGDVVGVRMPRGPALFEVIYGIELLGAVYLPIDPELPAARVEGMLQDAAAAYVVTPDDVPAPTDHRPVDVRAMPPVARDVNAPAYVLFTSGSTGRPKGVVVSHRAIDNRLAWMQDHLPLGPGDRVLHKTPISFDVSIWELFWPLQVGATVVIAAPGDHRDPRAMADLAVDERVSVLHFVPSMLRAFLTDRVARERVRQGVVRHVVTSGESLTPDLAVRCRDWFGVGPTNLYGPTEAAVDVTCWDCAGQDGEVPIGRPIWNTRCYVLDAHRRPVPLGVSGELWLSGVQLADGYVGRSDLTEERFVPDPFRPGERMYRTGDLAAWRPDGALTYLGRCDDQVKINGQRVELGEVEAVLAGAPAASAVAAGMVDERLTAWFVTAEGVTDSEAEQALREVAATGLPPAWRPQNWVTVSQIPLGTSGKTDRRRLIESAPPRVAATQRSGPRTLLEQRVGEIVAGVLGVEAVDPETDFFAAGGDSLRVLRLLAAVDEDLGASLELADVFAHPTPAGLAGLLAGTRSRTGETDEVLTLRRGGDRAPLFLLPPAGGLGWCYAGLLASLPADLGVHTVQAPGLAEGAPEPVADLGALAERQLSAIDRVVQGGAFHVAGWSLGGMAAHEVACLARDRGQHVRSVTLLDAYPSDQWQQLGEPTEEDALIGILRLGGLEPPSDVSELDRPAVMRRLRESGSAVGRLPAPVLQGCLASVAESARLVRSSRHRVLPGDLAVIVATAPRPETWLDAVSWKAHTRGEVHRFDVAATHGALVRRPVADEVGAILGRRCAL